MQRRMGSLAELRYPPFWILVGFLALAAATPWFRPGEGDLIMLAEAPATEPVVPDLPLNASRAGAPSDSAGGVPASNAGGSQTTVVTSTGDRPAEALRGPWRLLCQRGAGAEWSSPAEAPDTVRVAPGESAVGISPGESWHIQLLYSPVEVRRGRGYMLKFWARADQPRRVGCTVSQDHDPWKVLGQYATLELVDEWRPYQLAFVATADEPLARVQFDLAGEGPALELRTPELIVDAAPAGPGESQP